MLLRAATGGPAGAAAVLTLLVLHLGRAGSIAATRPLWQQQGNGPGRTYASAVEVPIPEQPVDALELQWTWFNQSAWNDGVVQQSLVVDGAGNVFTLVRLVEEICIVSLSANGTQRWLVSVAESNEFSCSSITFNTKGDFLLVTCYPVTGNIFTYNALGFNASDGSLKWSTSVPNVDDLTLITSPLVVSDSFLASSVYNGGGINGYEFG